MRIGLIGFGTVNSGVYEGLVETKEYLEAILKEPIEIKKILIRHKNKYQTFHKNYLLTDSPVEFLNHEFDLVFEAMGGVDPALDYLTILLSKRVSIITANKELIAKHGATLEDLASKNHVYLGYEAAVGGGTPIINTLRSQFQWTSVEKISGILNGTTNYLITNLTDGKRSFSDVLLEAQKLGFAEVNPTTDVEGFDALYKLIILSKLCFGEWIEPKQIVRRGMTDLKDYHFKIAKELGYTLKYIAEASISGSEITGFVTPCYLAQNHPLSIVDNEFNGVLIQGDWLKNIFVSGPGAGKQPTATSMIEDFLHHEKINNRDQDLLKRKKLKKKTAGNYLVINPTSDDINLSEITLLKTEKIDDYRISIIQSEKCLATLIHLIDQTNLEIFPLFPLGTEKKQKSVDELIYNESSLS